MDLLVTLPILTAAAVVGWYTVELGDRVYEAIKGTPKTGSGPLSDIPAANIGPPAPMIPVIESSAVSELQAGSAMAASAAPQIQEAAASQPAESSLMSQILNYASTETSASTQTQQTAATAIQAQIQAATQTANPPAASSSSSSSGSREPGRDQNMLAYQDYFGF